MKKKTTDQFVLFPTTKQICTCCKAVRFCEQVLHVEFKGDIRSVSDVSSFIGTYLLAAKVTMEDATESYYSNFDY